MSGKLELIIEDIDTTPVVNIEDMNTTLVVNIEDINTAPVVNIEDENITLVVNIEDNPMFGGTDTIPLSTNIDNQLTRVEDGYYVPPTSWEDVGDKPDSTIEEIDDAVSRSEQNASSIEGLKQSKVDKVDGKGLSTEDFTTENKEALNELVSGNYVWKETSW